MTKGPADCGGKQTWMVTKSQNVKINFTKKCSGGPSCSDYTPYENCKCQG
jgi:hypothetical protein